MQAIGRSGYAFYLAKYGGDFDPDTGSDEQYAALLFMVIITACVSVGYLIILLLLQPSAYSEFRAMLGLPPIARVDNTPRPSRSTMTQQNRSTVAKPSECYERKSTAPWMSSTNYNDAMGSERGTSFAGWAKSSILGLFEEENTFDDRPEDELFAVLRDMTSFAEHSATTSSMHQSRSSAGSISTVSTQHGGALEMSSMGSSHAGVSRSTDSSLEP